MAISSSDIRRRFDVFVMLFAVWVIFSGHFDALHLGLGLVCAALVTAVSSDLLLPASASPARPHAVWRLLTYIPWLLWEVVLANLHVVYLICRPAAMRPRVVRFRTALTGDLAKVTLGNSITLTPGTITLDIDGDEFRVHALSDKTAAAIGSGAMERRVARLFGQTPAARGPADQSTG